MDALGGRKGAGELAAKFGGMEVQLAMRIKALRNGVKGEQGGERGA
jgi:hypothetical protein